MRVHALISLLACALSLGFGTIVLSRDPERRLHKVFFFFSLAGSWLAFTEFGYRQAESFAVANFWLRASSLAMVTFPLQLHFVLCATDHEKILEKRSTALLLYAPAPLFTILELTGVHALEPVMASWGWTYAATAGDRLDGLWNIWLAALSLCCVGLLFRQVRELRAAEMKERYRTILVLVGVSMPIALAALSEPAGFLSALGIVIPELTSVGYIFECTLLALALWKYELFPLTPAAAADTIIATLADALFLIGPDGEILSTNHAMTELLGYGSGELRGRPAHTILASEERTRLQQIQTGQLQAMGVVRDAETTLVASNGQRIPVSLSVSTVRTEKGTAKGMVCVARDLTERKRAEAALVESNRRLEETLVELRDTQQRIVQQERLAAVGQLSAGIAHDFRNLLTTIVLHANLALLKPDLPKDLTPNLEAILSESEKAADLVQQILDFSRRSLIQMQTTDLGNVVRRVMDILRRTIPENIQLALEMTPAAASSGLLAQAFEVEVDPGRIEQVLMNLALNARDAMPEGGELRFCLSRVQAAPDDEPATKGVPPGEWVCLTVSDTGIGMTEDVEAHLFEPFFTTKEVGKGTGLGLAQVYGIMMQHKGHIDVETCVGEGTSFHLYLPAARSEERLGRGESSVDPLQGQGEMILLVEDNEKLREVAQTILESYGYQVRTAANGREALEVFNVQGGADLVVTDIVMPKIGGRELVQQLKCLQPNLKALGITGYTLHQVERELTEMGFLDVIQKPFDVETLVSTVRRSLDTN